MSTGKQRDGRFGKRLTLCITPAVWEKLQASSDRYGIAVSVLARGAMTQRLPFMLDARRRGSLHETRYGDGTQAAQTGPATGEDAPE